ncbi:MAG: CDP-glycerol glycerophosphotransferase family protein, partial [Actinomycetota bacterium]|nr:CDP-glycerol glycerophosphotransferase family protein [Actinomycetota bacterium]
DTPIDLADLCERLGTQFVLLVRAHYFVGNNDRLTALEEAGLLRTVTDYPVIEDLMIASDVLMTDYSSIMFDYAVLDRPIVIYAEDWDTYRRVRGVNFDLLAGPPGAVAVTQDELVDTFVSGRYRGAEAELARAEFHKRFDEFEDGHAAERVVRRVFLGESPASGSHDQQATGVAQGTQEESGDLVADRDLDDAVDAELAEVEPVDQSPGE